MLTLSHDKKIHENMKVPGFYRVTPDVLLVFISEIADIFQYIYIYIYIYIYLSRAFHFKMRNIQPLLDSSLLYFVSNACRLFCLSKMA